MVVAVKETVSVCDGEADVVVLVMSEKGDSGEVLCDGGREGDDGEMVVVVVVLCWWMSVVL